MKSKGFTLIELLVVVAIIGVLASIVLSALGEMKIRAEDATRKSDLNQIRTALVWWALDNNSTVRMQNSGCGAGGNGAGWLDYSYPGAVSIMDCLTDGGYISEEAVPYHWAYLKANCPDATYLFAQLFSQPFGEDIVPCSSYDTQYDRNYALRIPY